MQVQVEGKNEENATIGGGLPTLKQEVDDKRITFSMYEALTADESCYN